MTEYKQTFPALSELNYGLWSENMKALLKTKGLWGLVSGTLPRPTPTVEGSLTGDEKELLRAWKAKKEEVTGLLWLALEDGQKVHVKGKEDDAVQLWKAL
ncbi:hypothetical protein JAAARDRAFT_133811 [Jaapia argillacea MUCL 33604]|uniref:DUF4219 domain-containing protein n=1 Tax=Jaapia argillacea MUCL 33604 TaxID=933084 RepID=A0A067PVZ4_9AGAM|nr:hypothetical protein JAAARDRAFT_133811 [Jaapia argillacea MUCL 33604]